MGENFGRERITGIIMIDNETYRLIVIFILGIGVFAPRAAFAFLTALFVSHHWPLF